MSWQHIARVSLTGGALMFLTLWLHAFWVFGVELDYLNGGMQPMAPSLPVTTMFFAQLALVPAILSALLLGLTLAPIRHRLALRRGLTPLLWLILWLLSANAIAGQFVIDFGTTWGFMEPFRALMTHAVLTPASLIAGLTALWFTLR